MDYCMTFQCHLWPCYFKCGLLTISITWELVKMRLSGPAQDLLNQNFWGQGPEICIFIKSEKHWSGDACLRILSLPRGMKHNLYHWSGLRPFTILVRWWRFYFLFSREDNIKYYGFAALLGVSQFWVWVCNLTPALFLPSLATEVLFFSVFFDPGLSSSWSPH